MSHLAYLTALLLGIGGLLLIDRRLKLAFWDDARRTWTVIGRLFLLFFVWDVYGILYGIFGHGVTPYTLPFLLAPQFPFEELGFLFLFIYVALLLYRGTTRRGTQT